MFAIRKSLLRFPLVVYLSLAVCLIGALPAPSAAMWISPAAALPDRQADLARIRGGLENKLVSQRLADLGLTPSQVNERLSTLSDTQVHELASRLDTLIPGGDATLGIVIALLIIAILVVVLIQLSGHKVLITK